MMKVSFKILGFVASTISLNIYIFLLAEEELVTPPLNGLILPGVTRKSILELAREWVRDVLSFHTASPPPRKDPRYRLHCNR